ncbi:MAG: hypothetical protein JWP01_2182 [Myxococcales bacterium]|nr:hypothetical protein [Myxococcales bacterium]
MLAACDVGEVDIGGGGGTVDAPVSNSAKAMMFDSTIKPMAVTLGCLDAGCHSGLQMPILNTYADLAPRYTTGPGATNVLVLKGGPTPPGDHNGPYFDAAQRATIAAWIDMAP